LSKSRAGSGTLPLAGSANHSALAQAILGYIGQSACQAARRRPDTLQSPILWEIRKSSHSVNRQ